MRGIPESLNNLIHEFAKLPGIGKKTAERLAIYILKTNKDEVFPFSDAIIDVKNEIDFCETCHSFMEKSKCVICDDLSRDSKILCILKDPTDIFAIEKTGYKTEAEKFGWSFVFYQLVSEKTKKNVSETVSGAPWWWKVENSYWRKPYGPDSSIDDLQNHPVVHISWNDANAYANWIGKDLPTEAEWEMAARGGLDQNLFSWGNDDSAIHKKCNIWEGIFPEKNTLEDGWLATSPVDFYEPNDFNIYDTAGNTWEWCKDWFSSTFHQINRKETRINPLGPNYGTTKTMKGGSYLCHNSYCNRYRASARTQNTPDSSTGNLGFRLVYRIK